MRGQISALWQLEKWIFKILLETAQAIAFIMHLVSAGYSASLWCVRLLFVGRCKSQFVELLETPQTVGFIMLALLVAYSARFRLVRCVA